MIARVINNSLDRLASFLWLVATVAVVVEAVVVAPTARDWTLPSASVRASTTSVPLDVSLDFLQLSALPAKATSDPTTLSSRWDRMCDRHAFCMRMPKGESPTNAALLINFQFANFPSSGADVESYYLDMSSAMAQQTSYEGRQALVEGHRSSWGLMLIVEDFHAKYATLKISGLPPTFSLVTFVVLNSALMTIDPSPRVPLLSFVDFYVEGSVLRSLSVEDFSSSYRDGTVSFVDSVVNATLTNALGQNIGNPTALDMTMYRMNFTRIHVMNSTFIATCDVIALGTSANAVSRALVNVDVRIVNSTVRSFGCTSNTLNGISFASYGWDNVSFLVERSTIYVAAGSTIEVDRAPSAIFLMSVFSRNTTFSVLQTVAVCAGPRSWPLAPNGHTPTGCLHWISSQRHYRDDERTPLSLGEPTVVLSNNVDPLPTTRFLNCTTMENNNVLLENWPRGLLSSPTESCTSRNVVFLSNRAERFGYSGLFLCDSYLVVTLDDASVPGSASLSLTLPYVGAAAVVVDTLHHAMSQDLFAAIFGPRQFDDAIAWANACRDGAAVTLSQGGAKFGCPRNVSRGEVGRVVIDATTTWHARDLLQRYTGVPKRLGMSVSAVASSIVLETVLANATRERASPGMITWLRGRDVCAAFPSTPLAAPALVQLSPGTTSFASPLTAGIDDVAFGHPTAVPVWLLPWLNAADLWLSTVAAEGGMPSLPSSQQLIITRTQASVRDIAYGLQSQVLWLQHQPASESENTSTTSIFLPLNPSVLTIDRRRDGYSLSTIDWQEEATRLDVTVWILPGCTFVAASQTSLTEFRFRSHRYVGFTMYVANVSFILGAKSSAGSTVLLIARSTSFYDSALFYNTTCSFSNVIFDGMSLLDADGYSSMLFVANNTIRVRDSVIRASALSPLKTQFIQVASTMFYGSPNALALAEYVLGKHRVVGGGRSTLLVAPLDVSLINVSTAPGGLAIMDGIDFISVSTSSLIFLVIRQCRWILFAASQAINSWLIRMESAADVAGLVVLDSVFDVVNMSAVSFSPGTSSGGDTMVVIGRTSISCQMHVAVAGYYRFCTRIQDGNPSQILALALRTSVRNASMTVSNGTTWVTDGIGRIVGLDDAVSTFFATMLSVHALALSSVPWAAAVNASVLMVDVAIDVSTWEMNDEVVAPVAISPLDVQLSIAGSTIVVVASEPLSSQIDDTTCGALPIAARKEFPSGAGRDYSAATCANSPSRVISKGIITSRSTTRPVRLVAARSLELRQHCIFGQLLELSALTITAWQSQFIVHRVDNTSLPKAWFSAPAPTFILVTADTFLGGSFALVDSVRRVNLLATPIVKFTVATMLAYVSVRIQNVSDVLFFLPTSTTSLMGFFVLPETPDFNGYPVPSVHCLSIAIEDVRVLGGVLASIRVKNASFVTVYVSRVANISTVWSMVNVLNEVVGSTQRVWSVAEASLSERNLMRVRQLVARRQQGSVYAMIRPTCFWCVVVVNVSASFYVSSHTAAFAIRLESPAVRSVAGIRTGVQEEDDDDGDGVVAAVVLLRHVSCRSIIVGQVVDASTLLFLKGPPTPVVVLDNVSLAVVSTPGLGRVLPSASNPGRRYDIVHRMDDVTTTLTTGIPISGGWRVPSTIFEMLGPDLLVSDQIQVAITDVSLSVSAGFSDVAWCSAIRISGASATLQGIRMVNINVSTSSISERLTIFIGDNAPAANLASGQLNGLVGPSTLQDIRLWRVGNESIAGMSASYRVNFTANPINVVGRCVWFGPVGSAGAINVAESVDALKATFLPFPSASGGSAIKTPIVFGTVRVVPCGSCDAALDCNATNTISVEPIGVGVAPLSCNCTCRSDAAAGGPSAIMMMSPEEILSRQTQSAARFVPFGTTPRWRQVRAGRFVVRSSDCGLSWLPPVVGTVTATLVVNAPSSSATSSTALPVSNTGSSVASTEPPSTSPGQTTVTTSPLPPGETAAPTTTNWNGPSASSTSLTASASSVPPTVTSFSSSTSAPNVSTFGPFVTVAAAGSAPAAVVASAVTGAAVITGAAVGLLSPASATRAVNFQRVSASVLSCEMPADVAAGISPLVTSELQVVVPWAIPAAGGTFLLYAGGIMMCVVWIILPHAIAAGFYTRVRRVARRDVDDHLGASGLSPMSSSKAIDVPDPNFTRSRIIYGVAITVNSYFLPTVYEFATTMLHHAVRHGTGTASAIAALGVVVGVLLCMAGPMWLSWRAVEGLRNRTSLNNSPISQVPPQGKDAATDVDEAAVLRRSKVFLVGTVEGVITPIIDGSRSLQPFIAFAYFEDLIVAVAIAVIAGMRPMDAKQCPTVALSLSVVATLHLAYLCGLRPLDDRVEMVCAVIGAILQCVQCWLGYALVSNRADRSWSDAFLGVSYAQASFFFVQAIIVAGATVFRYWQRSSFGSTETEVLSLSITLRPPSDSVAAEPAHSGQVLHQSDAEENLGLLAVPLTNDYGRDDIPLLKVSDRVNPLQDIHQHAV